jgi:pimeloyl-ACP methyl ester carboxylesterase
MNFVETNGIRLAYEERGTGEPLVLIMGLGADGQVWDLHAQFYAQKFRCFLVDNRGTGHSDKPPGPYSTAQMADDYAGLIRKLHLGKVRVAGISMGGAVAQQLAIRHPDLVRSLVLVCTWAQCDEYARMIFDHFANARTAMRPADFVALLQLWIWTPQYMQDHAEELAEARRGAAVAAASGESSAWMPADAFEAQCQACMKHDTTTTVGTIKVPTLITVGTDDIFTPMRFSEHLHREIKGSQLKVFPGGGHVHHWEQLESFNRSTCQWLIEN